MGFMKNMKVDAITAEAVKAAEAGRGVFTPKLNTPATQAGLTGDISDWAVMIEAIEAAGWDLTHWAVSSDAKGRPEAYPFFRRRP